MLGGVIGGINQNGSEHCRFLWLLFLMIERETLRKRYFLQYLYRSAMSDCGHATERCVKSIKFLHNKVVELFLQIFFHSQ